MDKETYEALKVVAAFAHKHGVDNAYHDEFVRLLDWISEVAKDYEGPDATE
jgi:hypothetical protein